MPDQKCFAALVVAGVLITAVPGGDAPLKAGGPGKPLSPQEAQAMASGYIPIPAVWPRPHFTAGSVVNAQVIGSVTDPDPMLLIVSPDGRLRGITQKSNTKPEVQTVSP